MTVTIQKSTARGSVSAPPSKSMGHRLLISAALAEGESTVRGISPDSADMKATLGCLRALGATCTGTGDTVRVRGIDMKTATPKEALFCNESGSTLRFLIPIALLSGSNVMFSGSERLFNRPMSVQSITIWRTTAGKFALLLNSTHSGTNLP